MATTYISVLFLLTQIHSLEPVHAPLNYIWDTRRVPYNISSELDASIKATVQTAIAELEQSTCITFEPKTDLDIDYLHIAPAVTNQGCETEVGRQGGEQVLHLDNTCTALPGQVIHEFLHTLGFYHEHQRKDRHDYIDVNIENVLATKRDNFYTKFGLLRNITDLPYDYSSLTHYSATTFSTNKQPTIVVRDQTKAGLIGQRHHLSTGDIYKVQMYYNCENDVPLVDTCSVVPIQPMHGSWTAVQGHQQSVGNMIEYSCEDGYKLAGPTTRSCLLDGSWLAYSPYCIENSISYCNFDDNSWCDWTKTYEGSNIGYWYLNRIGTVDTQTGPNNDFTTMTSKGYFAYVEASEATSLDDVAILTSPNITTVSQDSCFRFSYSMYGKQIGRLSVWVIDEMSTRSIFNVQGGQGSRWWNETVNLNTPSNTQAQIRLRVEMTGNPKGDIALDDLIIGDCDKLPAIHS